MIWIGILLCLGITSSQGKPEHASNAEGLREAGGGDVKAKIFELVSEKKEGEQMFLIGLKGSREGKFERHVLVRTEEKLNWEEASARCQQLGDESIWTESGNLPSLLTAAGHQDIWRKRGLKDAAYRINVRKSGQEDPEPKIRDVWLGLEGEKCSYYRANDRSVVDHPCDKKLNAFLCKMS